MACSKYDKYSNEHSIVNMIGGDLYDHLISMRVFHLDNDEDKHISSKNNMECGYVLDFGLANHLIYLRLSYILEEVGLLNKSSHLRPIYLGITFS